MHLNKNLYCLLKDIWILKSSCSLKCPTHVPHIHRNNKASNNPSQPKHLITPLPWGKQCQWGGWVDQWEMWCWQRCPAGELCRHQPPCLVWLPQVTLAVSASFLLWLWGHRMQCWGRPVIPTQPAQSDHLSDRSSHQGGLAPGRWWWKNSQLVWLWSRRERQEACRTWSQCSGGCLLPPVSRWWNSQPATVTRVYSEPKSEQTWNLKVNIT